MFGWGSVASSLNTDKSVCAWKTNTNSTELTVYKTKSDNTTDVPSQQDTQIIVRGVCNAAANSIIEDYVSDTRAWITSAESKLATMAEYQRINETIQDFTKQADSRRELMQGRSQNSDILVLKRHRITDDEAPPKRLKLEAVDETTLDELGEMTQQGEYYSVIAGGMTKRFPVKGIVSVKAPEVFNLDLIVPEDSDAAAKVPQPSNMLSQPFRNSLQLKSHMTSLVQAFASSSQGKGRRDEIVAVSAEEHVPGNCFRHKSILFNEFKLAVRTFSNILTRQSNPALKSEFVIMEPNMDPIVMRKLNASTHVTPNNAARVVYRITRKVENTTSVKVVYTVSYRRPRRTNYQDFTDIATITYYNPEENLKDGGILSSDDSNVDVPFCYIFRVPAVVKTEGNEVFSRLSLFNLYNLSTAPEDLRIALGNETNEQTYITQPQTKMQQKNIWFRDFVCLNDKK